MQGDPQVIDFLNKALLNELTAINQYWLHYRMLDNWGVKKLAEFERGESIDEMKHADQLADRILFLGGDPDMRPDAFEPGKTVQEMLRKDLDLEYQVRENLAKGVALCERHGDYVSRQVLVTQLADTEEDHTWWLEKQLRLIEMIGLENYQQSRMGEDAAPG